MRKTLKDKNYAEIAEQSWTDEFSDGDFDDVSPPPTSVLSRMVSIGMNPEDWWDMGVEIPVDTVKFRMMIATQMERYVNNVTSELNFIITNYKKTMEGDNE